MPLAGGSFSTLRVRVEGVVRAATRWSQLLPRKWTDAPAAARVSVIAASAAGDLVLVRWLGTLPASKKGWAVRLPHIAADVAANTALFDARASYVPALNPAVAAGLEAGYEGDVRATAAVLVACFAGAAVGRRIRRRPIWPPGPLGLTGVVALCGWALRWYESAQVDAAGRAQRIDVEAAAAQAAAQARFAFYNQLDGARLLDDVKNAINPLIQADRAAVVAAQGMLQQQKEQARRPPVTALTLRRTLEEAEAGRYWIATNRASTFRPLVDPVSADTVLTPRQARQLIEWIEADRLTGRPEVRVLTGGDDIGAAVTLRVGDRRYRLWADQAPLELGPLGCLGMAAMLAGSAAPWDGSTPPWVAALTATLALGAAAGSVAVLHRRGRRRRDAAALLSAAPPLVHSWLATAAMRKRHSRSSTPLYPAVVALMTMGLEAGYYWNDLQPRSKWALAAAAFAAVAPSGKVENHDLRSLAGALTWVPPYFLLARDVRRHGEGLAATAAVDARAEADRSSGVSRAAAAAAEIDRLRGWLDAADGVLAAAIAADESLRAVTAARLAEVRERLVEMALQARSLGA